VGRIEIKNEIKKMIELEGLKQDKKNNYEFINK